MSKRYKQKRRERYYRNRIWDGAFTPSQGLDDADFEMEEAGPCWCGEKNPYFAPITRTCGGSRIINCICGGDFCVCHWHGEVECFGCEDCETECDPDEDYQPEDFEPFPL